MSNFYSQRNENSGTRMSFSRLFFRLSLSLSPGNPSPSSLILHYSVPWPLDVLFSENVMETYNSIFQLLLHVRWAKWNLEGISSRTSTISAMERGVALKVHFLYLLRSRLLHFVNSLSYYLMTRVSLINCLMTRGKSN